MERRRPTLSRKSSSVVRRAGAAALMMMAGLLAGGATVELTARYLLDDGMHFDLEMWKYARDIKRVSGNPDIGHEHRPGTAGNYMGVPVQINSIGLRDREFSEEKPSERVRILMLGDSLMFGWGVKAEDTPAKLLESGLNAGLPTPRYEVINAGVGNYNTVMEVAYFMERGRLLDPDVVVLNYFINDAEPVPRRRRSFLTEYSYAAVMLSSAVDKLRRIYLGGPDWKEYYAGLYSHDAPGWADARAAIHHLAEYCRENGVRLLVANYPELHQLHPYPFESVTRAVAETARTNEIFFVDLGPAVADMDPESLWVSPTDAHPNSRANIRFARAIRERLIESFPGVFAEGADPALAASTTDCANCDDQ